MEKYDANALAVFDTVCRALDGENLKYDTNKKDMIVYLSARGEDLPIDVIFKVDAGRGVLTVFSPLDTKAKEEKMVEFAVAVNAANFSLVNGSFDYDISDGKIMFRMAQPYLNGNISEKVVMYLFYCVFSTVDEYNDRFLMLDKGMIDLSKFIELANS